MLGVVIEEGSMDVLIATLVDIEGSFGILNYLFYCYFMHAFGVVTVSSHVVNCVSNFTLCVVS